MSHTRTVAIPHRRRHCRKLRREALPAVSMFTAAGRIGIQRELGVCFLELAAALAWRHPLDEEEWPYWAREV